MDVKFDPCGRLFVSSDGTRGSEGLVVAVEGVPTDGRDKPVDAVRVETITIEE